MDQSPTDTEDYRNMWQRVTAKFLLTRSVLTVGLVAVTAAVTALLAVHQAPSAAPPQVTHHPAAHAPAAHPAAAPAQVKAPAQVTAPAQVGAPATIVLRSGDTLSGLATTYHTTVAALQQSNQLGTSTLIYAGHTFTVAGTAPVPPQVPVQPTATATVAGPGATAAVSYALAQLGVPYRWGGSGTGGFDCSGLVMRAWAAGGAQLPHNAAAQAAAGTRITRDQLRPGDLVLSNGFGHVQLYIGAGRVVEAPHTGAVVRITALPLSSQVDAYVHVTA